jgi:hypothetical protein
MIAACRTEVMPEATPSGEGVDFILVVCPSEVDGTRVVSPTSDSRWKFCRVGTCADALDFVRRHRVPLVICEEELPDGSWREVLQATSMKPERPLLIVAYRLGDDPHWSSILGQSCKTPVAVSSTSKEYGRSSISSPHSAAPYRT